MLSGLASILPKVVRPARYVGNEWNSVVKGWAGHLHVALAYPDVYEEGICDPWMLSLYEVLNREDDILCERVYLPWPDMDGALRQAGLPLFALESQKALVDFDIALVILPGELYAPAVLTLLDLAGLPLHTGERPHGVAPTEPDTRRGGAGWPPNSNCPFVIGIGPATANPEPLATFFDAFIIGDVSAQALRDAVGALRSTQPAPAAGIYVPRLRHPDQPVTARRDDTLPPPLTRPIVPFAEAKHERGVVAMSHPPVYTWVGESERERPLDQILAAVEAVMGATGYDHILLTGWHSQMDEIVGRLSSRYNGQHIHISFAVLPMTVQAVDLADRLPRLNRGPLNFDLASGARPERLDAARLAFRRGWHILKLNTSAGLPGETADDVEATVSLARRIRDIGREEIDGQAQVHVVATPFIPRAHSPWQRMALLSGDDWDKHIEVLTRGVRGPGLRLLWRGLETRLVDAALARGDRRTGAVIEAAWHSGMRRPEDTQDAAAWQAAFAAEGLDMTSFATRTPAADETLPWQHIRLSQ